MFAQKHKATFALLMMIILTITMAGCATSTPSTPEVIEKTVEVPVERTVIVEKTVLVEAAPPVEEEMSEVQELRIHVGEPGMGSREGATLDPAYRGWYNEMTLLWSPIIAGDLDWNPQPFGLTTSWDVSEDGTVYTLHLRDDAKFSDGTPITAEDVKWSIGYYAMMAHPDIFGSHGQGGWFKHWGMYIIGAQDVIDGNVEYKEFEAFDLEGVKVIDEHTVEITLTRPYPYFLGGMIEFAMVVKPDSVKAGQGKEYVEEDWWATEDTAVFSGPFKLDSFSPGSGMTYVPNEYFWGKKPYLRKIIVTWGGDENTIVALFQNKEVDLVIARLGTDALMQVDPEYVFGLGEQNLIAQFWTTPYPPLDDVHVRRAISMAVDREALLKVLNAGSNLWEGTNGHFIPDYPPCIEEEKSVTPLPFDPEKAKEELAMSEYGDAVYDMEITIQQWTPKDGIVNQAVQKMLVDNLGLNVIIRTEQVKDWWAPTYPIHMWNNNQGEGSPDPALYLGGMISLIPDEPISADTMIPLITSPYIPELKDIFADFQNASTMEDACALEVQILQVWNDQVMSLDYGQIPFAYLKAPWVNNFRSRSGDFFMMFLEPGVEELWIAKH